MPEQGGSSLRLTLRTGVELHVLDVSLAGARVETIARLLPGSFVDVYVTTHGRRLARRVKVVRCVVSRIHERGVHYMGAIEFNGGPLFTTIG